MAGGLIAVAAALAATVAVANQPSWWAGLGAASLAAAASLIVSLAIVLPMFGRDAATLAYSFLVAGIVRTAVVGVIVVVAIKSGGYPMNATLGFAGALYAATVAIEGAVLWTFVGRPATLASSQRFNRHETTSLHPTRDRA